MKENGMCGRLTKFGHRIATVTHRKNTKKKILWCFRFSVGLPWLFLVCCLFSLGALFPNIPYRPPKSFCSRFSLCRPPFDLWVFLEICLGVFGGHLERFGRGVWDMCGRFLRLIWQVSVWDIWKVFGHVQKIETNTERTKQYLDTKLFLSGVVSKSSENSIGIQYDPSKGPGIQCGASIRKVFRQSRGANLRKTYEHVWSNCSVYPAPIAWQNSYVVQSYDQDTCLHSSEHIGLRH